MSTIRLALLLVALVFWTSMVSSADVDTEDTATDRRPLHTVIPDYPENARRDRIEGHVQVCFNVSRNGTPRRIAVRKSTHRVFEKPAMKAVRESRFVPLQDDVEDSGIKTCRTFRFYLEPVLNEPST